MVELFYHEGFHQLQNCFVADEDLHGRNILPLTYWLREVLKVPQEKKTMLKLLESAKIASIFTCF